MDAAIVIPALIVAAVLFALTLVVGAIIGARTRRVVVCPDDNEEAIVRCDPWRASRAMFIGGRQRVTECSRWPERKDCARECEPRIGGA